MDEDEEKNVMRRLWGMSQALSSEKLRKQTGWRPRKMGFLEGVEVYKAAFDVAFRDRDLGVGMVLEFWGFGRGEGGRKDSSLGTSNPHEQYR